MNAGPSAPTFRMVAHMESRSSSDPCSLANTPRGVRLRRALKSCEVFRRTGRISEGVARSISSSKLVVSTGQRSLSAVASIRCNWLGRPPLRALRKPREPVVSARICMSDSKRTHFAYRLIVSSCHRRRAIVLMDHNPDPTALEISPARGRHAGASREVPAPTRNASRPNFRAVAKGRRASASLVVRVTILLSVLVSSRKT